MPLGVQVGDGRKIVAASATAEKLAGATLCSAVCITAETDNTGVIVVGGSTVVSALATRRGTPLEPGASIELAVSDLATIWIDSMVSGDGVTYTYIN